MEVIETQLTHVDIREELGTPIESVIINVVEGENFKPEFLKIVRVPWPKSAELQIELADL